jgi:hypothetical protein
MKLSWALMHLAAAVAAVPGSARAVDDPAHSPCGTVTGTYLIRGTQQEASLPPREVFYLDRLLEPRLKNAADHFSFAFNAERHRIEVTVFDREARPIYSFDSRGDYTCEGGVLVRSTTVEGGGEGCSKSMVTTTRVTQQSEGLRFDSIEVGKYGVTCLSPSTEVHRTTTFPPYKP